MLVSWKSKQADALTSTSTRSALSKLAEVEKLVALLLYAAIDRWYL